MQNPPTLLYIHCGRTQSFLLIMTSVYTGALYELKLKQLPFYAYVKESTMISAFLQK